MISASSPPLAIAFTSCMQDAASNAVARPASSRAPAHPYTIGLLHAAQADRDGQGRFVTIGGEPPNPAAFEPGCPFAPRCGQAMQQCFATMPGAVVVRAQHSVNCWLYGAGDPPASLRNRGARS